MKQMTSFKEFLELAGAKYPVVVSGSIQADQLAPMAVYENLSNFLSKGLLLEVSESHPNQLFMSFNPRGSFKFNQNGCQVVIDDKSYFIRKDPLNSLREFQKLSKVSVSSKYSGLSDCIFGTMNYDSLRFFEEKLNKNQVDRYYPELSFLTYQVNLVFDSKNHGITLSVVTKISADLAKDYQDSVEFLKVLEKKIKEPLNDKLKVGSTSHEDSITSDVDDSNYQILVEKAKSYIRQGDIFQVVLSRTFKQKYAVSPLEIYRALRKITPAPYLFYLDNGDEIIIGASPEKLISVKNKKIETVPIAGTCKDQGQASVEALLNDEKELAEHIMLVDLSRNDLGKICSGGSVKIKSFLEPKKAGNLIHLTTIVSGELAEPYDAFDALKATFPAGTVSGAPKIRAMEIIDELEKTSRGLYAGALCLIDGSGNLDSALLIRTMILKNGVATIRAGAGIVYDSVPEKEAHESYAKAASILKAIQLAHEEVAQ